MQTELDAEAVAALEEWENAFANGPNMAQVAVAQKMPANMDLDKLNGIVFYCLWGVDDWRYSMIVHTQRKSARFMTPNNADNEKVSGAVPIEHITEDVRIIGKNDTQQQ